MKIAGSLGKGVIGGMCTVAGVSTLARLFDL